MYIYILRRQLLAASETAKKEFLLGGKGSKHFRYTSMGGDEKGEQSHVLKRNFPARAEGNESVS